MQNLKNGVKDKVRTDLDLHKESILGMGVYAIKRSYPKVVVGQIWKQYLKQLKNYAHIWKLKHCANADADADADVDADADRRRRQRLGDNISSLGTQSRRANTVEKRRKCSSGAISPLFHSILDTLDSCYLTHWSLKLN